jgi:hypothetical protein
MYISGMSPRNRNSRLFTRPRGSGTLVPQVGTLRPSRASYTESGCVKRHQHMCPQFVMAPAEAQGALAVPPQSALTPSTAVASLSRECTASPYSPLVPRQSPPKALLGNLEFYAPVEESIDFAFRLNCQLPRETDTDVRLLA